MLSSGVFYRVVGWRLTRVRVHVPALGILCTKETKDNDHTLGSKLKSAVFFSVLNGRLDSSLTFLNLAISCAKREYVSYPFTV